MKHDEKGRRPSQQQRVQEDRLTQQQVQLIVRQGGKALVDAAEKLGPRLEQGKLSTSQIRNVYGTVKQMEMRGFDPNEFVLLKPKLAYSAARANNSGARELREVLTWAIDEVGTDETKFARFVDFFEAVLAYHKAAGGK